MVELIPAGLEHKPVLTNLLELYIHDFSEFVSTDVAEDGRFGYAKLGLYWSDPHRRPFLARCDDRWAGFALVTWMPETQVWDMAEFFVLRRFRHRRIGTELAESVWRACPGKWQIRVMEPNEPARKFWQAAIEKFTLKDAQSTQSQAEGLVWNLFSFESLASR